MFRVAEQFQCGHKETDPLNRGLVSHFLCRPQFMGGNGLVGSAGRRRAKFVVSTTAPAWSSAMGRPGGYGAVKFTPSGTNGGYLDCDYTGISAYPFTMSAWACSTAVDTAYRTVFGVFSDTANIGWYGLTIRSVSSTQSRYGIQATNNDLGGGADNYSDTVSYTVSGWQHLVLVFSSATSRTVYANGVSRLTRTGSVTLNPSIASGSTWIGATNARGSLQSSSTFNGLIDDVRVWNRELTATEIQSLYLQSRRSFSNQFVKRSLFLPIISPETTRTATSSLTTANATLAASATFKPTYTATSTLVTSNSRLIAPVSFIPPSYTATPALLVHSATVSVVATFTKPAFTATSSLLAHSATISASATFSSASYSTGTATLLAHSVTVSIAATFTKPAYTAASVSVSTKSVTVSAAGTFSPGYTATASLSTHSATMASSAIFASVVYSVTSVLQTKNAILSSFNTFSPGSKTATAVLTTSKAAIVAAVIYTPPDSEVVPPHLEGDEKLYLIRDLSGILPLAVDLVGVLRFPGV